MSQRTIGGRVFLVVKFKGNRHFSVSEECTKREAGCKPHRHFHLIGEARSKDEAIATLEEAYGEKPNSALPADGPTALVPHQESPALRASAGTGHKARA